VIDAQTERLHRLAERVRLIGHFVLERFPGVAVATEPQ